MSEARRERIGDPKLPALVQATDDREMLGILSSALGPGGGTLVRVRHQVLKHTPGKRCVIDYRIQSDRVPGSARVIGKLYRADRGAEIFERLRRLHEASLAVDGARPPLGMPEPLAYLPELGMVLQSAVPGVPLSGVGDDADWTRAMRAAADNLATLHALPATLAEPKTMADHIHKLCRPAPEALVDEHPAFAPLVDDILDALRAVDASPAGPSSLAHGDLGLGQVLLQDSSAAFVDFDGLCRSRAALDVGNFLVSLRGRLGGASLDPARTFIERYLEHHPRESLTHLGPFQALAYLRRAMIAFRTRTDGAWTGKAERLLTVASWIGRADSDVVPSEDEA